MASPTPFTLLLCCFLIFLHLGPLIQAQIDETSLKLVTEGLDWPAATMSLLDDELEEADDEDGEDLELDVENGYARRSLFWRRMKYYISYGALSANRIPCPPRSGRSYYTHNCFKARGPVRPYFRGCSRITRCRR
uniref:Rapid alkalinization factor 20 n=1 Tax=Pyrus x bretschneideri TaxID=225117 RepID=A0A650F6F5_9ROSA|nr:rapid alkalinization factor 20 [Pyrus x bretschneideri]